MPLAKGMDPLGALSDDDDSEEEEEAKEEPQPPPAKKQQIDYETLQEAGFVSGPSVLHMPAPKDGGQSNWAWASGKAQKVGGEDESSDDRKATRDAANDGAQEMARRALLAQEHDRKLREDARKERADMKHADRGKEKRLKDQKKKEKEHETWNQKEKRKREQGAAKGGGKNFIEEEKRVMREFGMYSGFD